MVILPLQQDYNVTWLQLAQEGRLHRCLVLVGDTFVIIWARSRQPTSTASNPRKGHASQVRDLLDWKHERCTMRVTNQKQRSLWSSCTTSIWCEARQDPRLSSGVPRRCSRSNPTVLVDWPFPNLGGIPQMRAGVKHSRTVEAEFCSVRGGTGRLV